MFFPQQKQLTEWLYSVLKHMPLGKFPQLSYSTIPFYKSKYDPKNPIALNISKYLCSEEYTRKRLRMTL